MKITNDTTTLDIARLIGPEATEREGRVLFGILSRECVVDTDEIYPEQWEAWKNEARSIIKAEGRAPEKTETRHTPETLTLGQGMIYSETDPKGETVATYKDPVLGARLVESFNACAGINPEAVPEMLKALESFTRGVDAAEERGDLGLELSRLNYHRRRIRAAIDKART